MYSSNPTVLIRNQKNDATLQLPIHSVTGKLRPSDKIRPSEKKHYPHRETQKKLF